MKLLGTTPRANNKKHFIDWMESSSAMFHSWYGLQIFSLIKKKSKPIRNMNERKIHQWILNINPLIFTKDILESQVTRDWESIPGFLPCPNILPQRTSAVSALLLGQDTRPNRLVLWSSREVLVLCAALKTHWAIDLGKKKASKFCVFWFLTLVSNLILLTEWPNK